MSTPKAQALSAFRPSLEVLSERLAPAVFTVTSVADTGVGTFREAIMKANQVPGPDTIAFNLPTVGGVATITPRSALPEITDTVVIDGRSQPGYFSRPVVELNGSLAGPGADGLRLSAFASKSTVQGIVVNRFSGDGIELRNVSHTLVRGCYVGIDATGTQDRGNGVYGVHVSGGFGNQVGTGEFADINVISGNDGTGLAIRNGASNTTAYGNFVGLDSKAVFPVGNGTGVLIENSPNNRLGNTFQTWGGNVISGNGGMGGGDGVNVRGAAAIGNRIEGNRIGLNTATNAAAPNYHGILINGSSKTQISDNTISWNRGSGVVLMGAETTGTVVVRNRIGASPANLYGGTPFARPNAGNGVLITGGASGNTIGGASKAEENIIAFNGQYGVDGKAGNTVNAFNQIFGNSSGQVI